MTGRRSHGRLSALNGVVHQGSSAPTGCGGAVCVVEVRFPIVHQLPPIEQVRSGIGGLDLVLDDGRQRRLHDFTRLCCDFGRRRLVI